MNDQLHPVLDAARGLAQYFRNADRSMRREGITGPSAELKEEVASRFWELVRAIDRLDGARDDPGLRGQCRDILGAWLFRCRYFNRSYYKPHGYAGDFRIIEWIYDLEGDPCADPTQPGIVNCLDHVFARFPCVQSVWERRHWLARLLREEYYRRGGRLRILDVACGGGRYLADFLSSVPDACEVELTVIDQDPAALEYCRTISLSRWRPQLTARCLPIHRLLVTPSGGPFDVVISAGLFDYLNDDTAAGLLAHLVGVTAPGGVTAIANFHPADPSRNIRDWLQDWPLIHRDEAELSALFPEPAWVATSLSSNGALSFALAQCPASRVGSLGRAAYASAAQSDSTVCSNR
jgi:SAM-dependent methyltransferase